jgi:hypothetical protein
VSCGRERERDDWMMLEDGEGKDERPATCTVRGVTDGADHLPLTGSYTSP